MLVTKIDDVLSSTSKITNFPPHVVASVISHTFKYIANYLKFPIKAGIRLQHFGIIRGNLPSLNAFIRKHLIPQTREDPTKKPTLTSYWNLRQLLMKDKDRRNFTKRFNKQ